MLVRSTRSLKRQGAAAAELAIWLPFLTLMFAVAIDFCRVYFATQTVQNCAAAAALYASNVATSDPANVSASDAIAQAAIAEGASLSPALQAANVTTATVGTSVQVTVSYDFALITRLPGLSNTITIRRTVTMASVPAAGT
jgi:Flp pilus assembly protein TadG